MFKLGLFLSVKRLAAHDHFKTHVHTHHWQTTWCSSHWPQEHFSIYFATCFCNLRRSVKSSFVWSFGVIVSCGGQGYHSSLAINAGLSALVVFGRQRLSSWACASSYHPGGQAPALLKQTISLTHTYVFLADQKGLWFEFPYKWYLSVIISHWFKTS